MKTRRFAILAAAVLCLTSILSGCSRISESLPEESAGPGSLSPNNEEKITDDSVYIYSLLSAQEQVYYDIFKEAVDNFAPSVTFPEVLEPDELRKLLVAVYNQEEEQFWLASLFFRPNTATNTLRLEYRFPQADIPRMQAEIDSVTDSIFSRFTEETTDYEKLKAFHDHLVLNCTFSKDTEYVNTIYGALVDGYAQCEGYAFAFDYLCMLADIDCFTVSGTNPEGELHAWNMVKLDGKWYHVDCTWDDPILDPPDTEFIRYYYFLVQDSDIIGATHIVDCTYFTPPMCTDGNSYYVRENLTASTAEEGIEILKQNAADVLLQGRKDAAVRFTNYEAYSSAVSKLFDSKKIREVFDAANSSGAPRKVKPGKYVRYCNDTEMIIHISMFYEDE
ncbi:MAG: transglutaminase domain-containing protein [Huintestinicola sp.]